MATIEQNLQTLQSNKTNIKSAIESLINDTLSEDMSTWSNAITAYRTKISAFLWGYRDYSSTKSSIIYMPYTSRMTTIRAALFWGIYVTKIVFDPDQNITDIGAQAFYRTFNLDTIVLPTVGWQNVISIGAQAFQYAHGLGFFDFGNSITTIGNSAFANAGSSTSDHKLTVIFRATTPPTLGTTVFTPSNLTGGLYIYVPDASLNDYKTATNWATYASYIYPLSEYESDSE